MTLRQDNGEGIKYEVKELGATEMRRGKRGKQGGNDEWRPNPCSCGVDVPWYAKRMKPTQMLALQRLAGNFLGQVGEILSDLEDFSRQSTCWGV